ncbi:MAG TPA: secretin N-terminal domain-containing protein [Opitutaceae bacterium]|jgi:general secretion pathway protein D|nr:secretin N-terminal domain-containing protein [Opitutaceae bacterium]
MRPRFFCLALALSLAALRAPAQTPPAVPAAGPAVPAAPAGTDDMINGLSLSDAPIDSILQLLETWTGRTILRPQSLPAATYSINITRPLPKSEATRALETLLGLNGVGVVPLGDKFLKVVQLNQASREAPQLIEGSTLDLPPSGRVAAKLFQLQFLRVNEIIPQIQQIMSPGIQTPPVQFESANAALIVDTISNLQRIEFLLKSIDQPLAANLTPRFYPIHNAKASDLVSKLHSLFTGPLQSQLGSATTYNADDRTNQIILISDSRQYPFFDNIIAKLDIKSDPNTRTEVIYLKHAVSKDVANLLSQLISNQNSLVQKSGQTTTPNQPNQPNQPGRPALPATLNSLGLKDEGGATEFSSYCMVISDDRSNAIVVSGTGDDIRLIQNVVDKIDILLAQVSIQVIIAEVTLDDIETSGLSAFTATINTDTPANPATNGDNGRGTHITNFTGTVGSWAVTSGVVAPLAFQAALQNNGSTNNIKILSADTITTTHAKEADFVVSTQEPIITGTTSVPNGLATNNGLSTSSSVTYQNIGIEVKVTPLIGVDGSIQLTIDQKVDDAEPTPAVIDGNNQPIIDHREANSYVNVQDGQMVVLGGLQQTTKSTNHVKLGFFYEIPILSNLLGARDNETHRKEILFFIRPHVIPATEGTSDAKKRIDELSNKGDIKQYLQDPTVQPKKDSLKDRFYKE